MNEFNLKAIVRTLKKELRSVDLQKEKLEHAIKSLGGFSSAKPSARNPIRKPHQMSAEGRAAIIAAQKKRWAAYKASKK